MILYFSGSGNSKYIAQFVADKLEDELVSLMNYTKNKAADSIPEFNSEKPYVVVAPIYAWRYPVIVEDLLKTANFNGNKIIYCLATMGSETGNADKYLKKIFDEKDMMFKGFEGIEMPNNFIFGGNIPSESESNRIIETALSAAMNCVEKIKAEAEIEKRDKTFLPGLMSGLVNKGFTKMFSSARGYYVNEKCISCGECVNICPLGNIKLKDNKPVFGSDCTACYACIHNCRKEAIEINGRTEGKPRYHCPEYSKKI